MDNKKKAKLQRAGWKTGNAKEFLGLSDEEHALVEMKLALASSLRKLRQSRRMTQANVSKAIGSSQSRVAKMESADASVSIDLYVRALLSLGKSRKEVGIIIGQRPETASA